MKYSMLKAYEKLFKRTPFKAVENMTDLSADEQQWFVWAYRCSQYAPNEVSIGSVDEWTPVELREAVGNFFDVTGASTPS